MPVNQTQITNDFLSENKEYELSLNLVLDIDEGGQYSEFDEICDGKNLDQLYTELRFQTLDMGESNGSPVCRFIVNRIIELEDADKLSL